MLLCPHLRQQPRAITPEPHGYNGNVAPYDDLVALNKGLVAPDDDLAVLRPEEPPSSQNGEVIARACEIVVGGYEFFADKY